MTDEPRNDVRSDFGTDRVDASGQPLDVDEVAPPEQAPMDDAAGGPQADPGTDWAAEIEGARRARTAWARWCTDVAAERAADVVEQVARG